MALLNTYIAASAGAGKTYQLVSRFLTLLCLQKLSPEGIQVSNIIAITFTRKAAAEFKARILADLAQAAQTDEEALACWKERIAPILSEMNIALSIEEHRQFFTDILAEVMNQFAQLNLGTIDSLFQRMARTLCAELGLARLSPLDPKEEEAKRRAALDLTYEQRFLAGDDTSSSLLEDAITASLDRESALSQADSSIFELVNKYHEIMLSSPHAVWGGKPDEMTEEELALFGLTKADITVKSSEQEWREKLHALIAILEDDLEKKDQQTFPSPIKDPDEKGQYIFPKRAGIVRMHANSVRTYRKKFLQYVQSIASLHQKLLSIEVKELPDAPPEQQAQNRYAPYWDICRELGYDLSELLHERRAHVWRRLLQRTQALHQLLTEVEHNYENEVRKQGLFTFSDVSRLLEGKVDEQSYALVQERLDAQLQHWLLDEFQDTSFGQYDILRDLLLARAQEGDEGSVFMVGDAKQSIYQFRGGDPKVFLGARDGIFGLASEEQKRSQEKPLNCSYRSSQSVLDFANLLFGDQFPNYASYASAGAHEIWNSLQFLEHRAARKLSGCVEIWKTHREAEGVAKGETSYHLIAELLQRTRPIAAQKHGESLPSCAILVSTRSEGLKIYEQLQQLQPSYPFAGPIIFCDEREVGSDNALGLSLTQLFSWLLCPEDKQSFGLLRLSPLWKSVQAITKSPTPSACWESLHQLTAQAGIAQLLRELSQLLRGMIDENTHFQQSWKIWFAEAESFDESGGTLAEWLEHIKKLRLRSEVQGDAIRIMTIHQSKGLEFDSVILPFLAKQGELASYRKRSILQYKNEHGESLALLIPPSDEEWAKENKILFDNMIAPWRAQEEFASFCKLYVAVTRAKRATYIIIPARSAESTSKSESFRHIMEEVIEHAPAPESHGEPPSSELGRCEYLLGSPYWYEEEPAHKPKQAASVQAELHLPDYHFHGLTRRTPSTMDEEEQTAAQIIKHVATAQTTTLSGTELGNIIHAVMQEITWLDEHRDIPPFKLVNELEQYRDQITNCITEALYSASWREHFTRPRETVRLYREQNIEAKTKNNWVSGQIDRLHVTLDKAGQRAVAAHIYDYKTNAGADESKLKDHYREQMRAYRNMVALAFGLSVDSVAVTLLHCPLHGEANAWTYTLADW